MTAPLTLTWQKGGDAVIESCDGTAIVLLSSVPAPPGAPLTGTLASGMEIQVKVHGSKKQDGEPVRFRIQGRLLNASRAVKDQLGV